MEARKPAKSNPKTRSPAPHLHTDVKLSLTATGQLKSDILAKAVATNLKRATEAVLKTQRPNKKQKIPPSEKETTEEKREASRLAQTKKRKLQSQLVIDGLKPKKQKQEETCCEMIERYDSSTMIIIDISDRRRKGKCYEYALCLITVSDI